MTMKYHVAAAVRCCRACRFDAVRAGQDAGADAVGNT